MDQFIGCPIDEKSQEIIDRIINSEGGKAVIHYIAVYRKKTGDDVKEEKIETQYREFLKELIYVGQMEDARLDEKTKNNSIRILAILIRGVDIMPSLASFTRV